MIQNQIEPYIRVCMKTWLLCESAIHNELRKKFPCENLLQACGDCGRSCFALVSQLASDQPYDTGYKVWDCLLYCRQCAEICEQFGINEEDYQLCKEACETCAGHLKEILPFYLN